MIFRGGSPGVATSCSIVPPYVLERIAAAGGPDAERARRALALDTSLRRVRSVAAATAFPPATEPAPGPPAGPRRTISTAGGAETLPGTVVRVEGDPPSGDAAADEAYDGMGETYALYRDAYGRDSIDGAGLALAGTVHYGQDYANAFWDGTQVVFGDGDGQYFTRLTVALDVIGHELSHGVVDHEAGLIYQGQSGALNESVCDVFGSLVKQRRLGQDAASADWLIGAGLFTAAVQGLALRSMRAPGTAYDDPVLGRDPQPGHLDGYVETDEDKGGVHINSGIPNRAFYLLATELGGSAAERAGAIWYATLTGPDLTPGADFAAFAAATLAAAGKSFGAAEVAAVRAAWTGVGIEIP